MHNQQQLQVGDSAHAALGGRPSRRRFLHVVGSSLAVAALPLVNACTPAPSPSAPPAATNVVPAAPTVSGTPAKAPTLQLPARVPFQGPKPDLPGDPAVDLADGYARLPTAPVKSVTKTPGRGGKVEASSWTVLKPPLPADQNTWWQELNNQLGVNLSLNIATFADYPNRFQVMMAGGDLPDIIATPYGTITPRLPDFLKASCADLTPFLSGDAVKAYPNLANFSTDSWRSVVFGGRILGVPIPYPPIGSVLWVHHELLEEIGSAGPKNANEFKQTLLALTRPQTGLWGISLAPSGATGMAVNMYNGFFPAMFRAPTGWSVDDRGSLTSTFETQEYRAALSYNRELFAAGVYHPDSPSYDSITSRLAFQARKFAFMNGGIGSNNASQYMDTPVPMEPPSKIRPLAPFAFDGGQAMYSMVMPNHGFAALKKANDDRIRELLGILDFMSAPFGSEEYMLLHYGVQGSDYVIDSSGNPSLTPSGRNNDLSGVLQYVTNAPYVLYNPNNPNPGEFAAIMQAADRAVLAVGVPDPTRFLYSVTNDTQGAVLNNQLMAGMSEIIRGQRPYSDYDQLLSDWRTHGGDQMRKEFQQALAASSA